MKYAGKAVCLVMCNGDIIAAYEDDDEAEGKAFEINNGNADAAARDAGYDPDDLSDSEAAEFAFKGGFDGYAYVEYVQIPEEDEEDTDEDDEDDGNFSRTDEDTEFFTSEGDTLTYGDVISAIDAMYANQDDDPEEDDEDSNEDDSNSDENGDGFDMGDDPDFLF